jgi:hypothetical protein
VIVPSPSSPSRDVRLYRVTSARVRFEVRDRTVVEVPVHDETMVSDRLQFVEGFRDAHQERDRNRLTDLFAEDAELTWTVGTFRRPGTPVSEDGSSAR